MNTIVNNRRRYMRRAKHHFARTTTEYTLIDDVVGKTSMENLQWYVLETICEPRRARQAWVVHAIKPLNNWYSSPPRSNDVSQRALSDDEEHSVRDAVIVDQCVSECVKTCRQVPHKRCWSSRKARVVRDEDIHTTEGIGNMGT
jgi:hypothetical protein